MLSTILKVLAFTCALSSIEIEGHANLVDPKPNWGPKHKWGTNSPSGTIDGSQFIPYPDKIPEWEHANGFVAYFQQQTKYETVYDLILDLYTPSKDMDEGKECGVTQNVGTPQKLPSVVKVTEHTHPGPCELFCDDKLIFQNMRCESGEYRKNIPIDTSKCAGAKTLKWVWLGLHVREYQVYINCATLEGSTSPPVSEAVATDDDEEEQQEEPLEEEEEETEEPVEEEVQEEPEEPEEDEEEQEEPTTKDPAIPEAGEYPAPTEAPEIPSGGKCRSLRRN